MPISMPSDQDVVEADSDREVTESGRDTDQNAAASSKGPAKRRTKTGCLTCRKRRIKCGEERPTCKNCIKSKRECAGYVQPLVYKQHHHGTPPLAHDPHVRTPYDEHGNFHFGDYPAPDSAVSHTSYDHDHFTHEQLARTVQPYSDQRYHYQVTHSHSQIPDGGINQHMSFHVQQELSSDAHRRHSAYDATFQHPDFVRGLAQPRVVERTQSWSYLPQSHYSTSQQFNLTSQPHHNAATIYHIDPSLQAFTGAPPTSGTYGGATLHGEPARRYSTHGFIQSTIHPTVVPVLANPSMRSHCEELDFDDPEDPYDVEMDVSSRIFLSTKNAEECFSDIMFRKRGHISLGHSRLSSQPWTSHSLQQYRSTTVLSPLQEERNKSVFCHFVEIIAKCISIFERQPLSTLAKPAETLWGYKIPVAAMSHPALAHALLAVSALHISKLQQTSEDPALKHFTYSVRRVGKLLSLLPRRHETATLATVLLLGFYEVVAADHSRWNLHLAGATKLILEHDFARMTAIVRRMRAEGKQNDNSATQHSGPLNKSYLHAVELPDSLADTKEWNVDAALLASLSGMKIDYDNQVQPGFRRYEDQQSMDEASVSDYKAKMDLWWWYCKQDMFQSMVSGDPLLMPYEHWKYCPPRGQIGDASITHATFDHLILILARLANFGGIDRLRKQHAVAEQGGQWRPPPPGVFTPNMPPGMGAKPMNMSTMGSHPSNPSSLNSNEQSTEPKKASVPSANEGRARRNKSSSSSQEHPVMSEPPMYGMLPASLAPPKMNPSFYAMDAVLKDQSFGPQEASQAETAAESNSEESTRKAIGEHAMIVHAFDLFFAALGPDFQPIPNDSTLPNSTPFGPPIRYKSNDVACIWALYYTGRILLYRVHPYMPPAAMIAAGVAAPMTRGYAQTIGRICGGIYSSQLASPGSTLDPAFAGSMMESTFPLLFAAVQYQDMSQRGWTISKLQDIARMTGWQTSAAVAAACETAWERMGQAGRGPLYARTLDRNNKDVRVNGKQRLRETELFTRSSQMTDPEFDKQTEVMSHSRNLIGKHGSSRVHWALGLLSVEEDIRKLKIDGT